MFPARVLILAILTIAFVPVAAAEDDLAALNDPMGLAGRTVTDLYPKTALLRDLVAGVATMSWESNATASRVAIDLVATEGGDPDVSESVDHVPAPYELHNDGTNDVTVAAQGKYAHLCPGRVAVDPTSAPYGYFVGLRCGGDLDGDGWPDLYEVDVGSDPLDPNSTP